MPALHDTIAGADDWYVHTLAQAGVSQFIDAAHGRIHYLAWGESSPVKPVLMLVHGYRGHAHWWDIIAPHFMEQFRVIAPDLAGMGDSSPPGRYDECTLAENIIAVAEHECASPAVIVAHSFGGSRSLLACLERPGLFARAIVVDSWFPLDGERLPAEPPVKAGRVYPDLATALARFRLLPEQPSGPSVLMKHLALHSLREVPGGWTWKFDAHLPLVNRLRAGSHIAFDELRLPVDYICGEFSAVVSLERARRIAAALPPRPRRPIVIPRAYHHLMIDQPVALIAALRALLA